MKKFIALLLAASMCVFVLAACGSTSNNTQTETKEAVDTVVATDANSGSDPAGFTEYPIFEDEELGFVNLSAVYFQPVPMSNGNENIEDFNIHLEADISALENDLGYEPGSWVPYMTVDYDVIKEDGTSAAKGSFMVMSASDGPHYGANIALPESGTYSLKITLHSPEENGYLIHIDSETGPGGTFDEYFADGNLEFTFEGWDYTVQEW